MSILKTTTSLAIALSTVSATLLGTVPAASASTSKTLNVLMPVSPDTHALQAAFPAFEKQTGIKINLTTVPQSQLAADMQLQVTTHAGTYDVAGYQYEDMPGYSKDLLPLGRYITAQDRKDFTSTGLRASSYGGRIYGLPYELTMEVLFYRKDLLSAAHLSVPTTWTRFLADAQRLTKPPVWGTIVEAQNTEEPVGMTLDYLYQAGGDILGPNNKVTIDSPAAVHALQFEVNLVKKYKVAPPNAASLSTLDIANLYQAGHLALAPNWAYQWGESTAATSQYKSVTGVAPLPCDVKCGVSLGGWLLSAFKTTKNPAAAVEFIKYMTDTKTQLMMALTDGSQPTRYSVINNPKVKSIPLFRVMSKELAYGVSRTKYPAFPEISSAVATAQSAALSGQESPQAALRAAAATIQQSLSLAKG
jgi:multiple sugar transport system substrate-binding protein